MLFSRPSLLVTIYDKFYVLILTYYVLFIHARIHKLSSEILKFLQKLKIHWVCCKTYFGETLALLIVLLCRVILICIHKQKLVKLNVIKMIFSFIINGEKLKGTTKVQDAYKKLKIQKNPLEVYGIAIKLSRILE